MLQLDLLVKQQTSPLIYAGLFNNLVHLNPMPSLQSTIFLHQINIQWSEPSPSPTFY